MQEQLKQALDFSKYRETFAIQRKTLKEKIDARLTYGINGGIFKINRELINFVQMLIGAERTEGVVLLDVNNNPILIDNLVEFKDEILDRYMTSTLEYYEEYQKLKKSRSVESLIAD
jgi:hypothetical protein|tara:strand:- start:7215 stop:7565 length:351 start_codon:yes stop_codon:yes gene_type:complete